VSKQLRVHAPFGDGMILQREGIVPIWGSGEEGANIVVRCGETKAEAVVQGGKWEAKLPPFPAGGPYELTVQSGQDVVKFEDVLFGDVWLAGGQSNMEWPLKEALNGDKEIAAADFPLIRFYNVPQIAYDDGLEHRSEWRSCSPATAGDISAVGYFFARRLARSVDVPIGIVGCNWGGTSASCWVPEKVLASDPGLKRYLVEYDNALAKLGDEPARRLAEARYEESVQEYLRKEKLGFNGTELGDYPWPPPLTERSNFRPCGLYENLIRRTAPYALKGILYYQGETDAEDAEKPLMYDRLLTGLIRTWRRDWRRPDLPFLFVQLPGYARDGRPNGEEWALLRESQQIVSETVPNTAMAVTLDLGESHDIHPRNKKPVGERLALGALRAVYGEEVVSTGPALQGLIAEKGSVRLYFDTSGAGLAVRDGGELTGFQVSGKDGVYYDAKATIDGDVVEASSDLVKDAYAIRYGWANDPKANLMNGQGLPAGPFRTDRQR
jgi:sialate O-acetylesterase